MAEEDEWPKGNADIEYDLFAPMAVRFPWTIPDKVAEYYQKWVPRMVAVFKAQRQKEIDDVPHPNTRE